MAEDFGDISVSAAAMFTGNTLHGYGETRVTLQNRSSTKTHSVTLVFPNNPWSSGNAINRLSRSVKLGPGEQVVVPLLQPPLPAFGDGMMRVDIDGGGGDPNLIRMPNANNHMNVGRSFGGRNSGAVAFISRSLDYDATTRVLNSGRGQFTAAMATGAPDSNGRSGMLATAWMPDTSLSGGTNWLELVYKLPTTAEKILIYHTLPLPPGGNIVLIGVSGTNIAQLSMTGGTTSSARRNETEFTLPKMLETVKMVRLEFGVEPPSNISIDAVEIIGASGNAWASDATASSDNFAAAASGSYGGAGLDIPESLRAESTVSEWSEDWLAYTPFDVIALNSIDFNSATPAVITALGNYLSAGGNIILFGKDTLPAAWHAAEKTILADGMEYQTGLGHCLVISQGNLSNVDTSTTRKLRDLIGESARYWQLLPHDAGAANSAFPVVENLKIPVRGIVIIMLAFIIVIGPVNIILLNRRQRRTWMLWTIPAISFVTTLIVFAYSLLREGITPDTRIAGLTLLDQPNHHAATIGVTAFYCPLTPSSGLRFDYETEATPLVQLSYGPSGNRRELDWTQTQYLQHGWVSARVPAHFHLRKSETRRERLQVVSDHGQISVVNGLGAPVKSLWLADADGKFYQAENIAAGQKAGLILKPAFSLNNPRHSVEKSNAEGFFHDVGFTANMETLNDTVPKYLRPGTYIAVLDGNPFIENALGTAASPKRTRTTGVVFGILDAPDAL